MPKKRGRKAVPVDPAMKKLEQENRRLTTRLKKAEALLESTLPAEQRVAGIHDQADDVWLGMIDRNVTLITGPSVSQCH
jgi:hypothetical protein